jgi:hypothetical protein
MALDEGGRGGKQIEAVEPELAFFFFFCGPSVQRADAKACVQGPPS